MKQYQIQSGIWAGFPATIIIGLLLSVVGSSSQAANQTWNGAGDGTTMNSGANWVSTIAPVTTDSLFFAGTTGLSVNNNYAANFVFNGITFNSTAGAFTLSGTSPIYLGAGVTNNSASAETISVDLFANSGSRNIEVNGGNLTCVRYYDNGNGRTLTKSGTGTLTIAGTADDSYLQLTINAGTVVLAKASTSSIHCTGNPVTIGTNSTLVVSGTGGDQIYDRSHITFLQGAKMQVQTNESIFALYGTNNPIVVEDGLAGNASQLTVGAYNNARGNFYGTIQDGSASGNMLSLRVNGNSNIQQLWGTNTYSGTTTVAVSGAGFGKLLINGKHIGGGAYSVSGSAAGDLAYLGGSGIISASVVNFGAYGYLSPGGTSSDADSATFANTTATLTFSNAVNLTAASSTLELQLNSTTAGSGYDQVNIAGSGSFSNNAANLSLTLGYTPVTGDKFTIVQVQGTNSTSNIGIFGTLNGAATDLSQGAIFVEPVTGKRFQISYRAEGSTFDMGAGNGNDIMLQVLPDLGGTLTWRGDGVNNTWDINTTVDWWNGTNLVTFSNNPVAFDNSGSNNIPINLTTTVTPPSLLFNTTNNYVIAGSGNLAGAVTVTKTNTGTLAIVTENDTLTGSTIINRGVFQIDTNGATGSWSGNIIVNSNGVLAYDRSDNVNPSGLSFSGIGGFVHNGSGQLTFTANLSSFSGNTTNTGGLLQLGDGSGAIGQIGGTVYVPATNTLQYNYLQDANVVNAIGGSGTVTYESQNAGTLTLATTAISTNFTGTNNLVAGVRVHAQNGSSYAFGNGSTINVPAYSQAWCDNASTAYNNIFNIAGTGWIGTTPSTGAISVYGCTFTGAINLLANARISGTITGGTILCPISGNYQLEVWGTAGSYVLSIGSTNGLNSYASTLITSGSVRALTNNAISTGPLAMDLAGDLRLNGYSLAVSNLASANPSHITGTGATIQNIGTTPATLTVGADNNNTEFDGLFFDGGAASLSLTKVGTGTLTLTGTSTNTGTVAVKGGTLLLTSSGSFNNAAVIAVSSGATYDVTGAGGTLTLNSGQTLTGSGMINGNVSTSAGSVINPGDSIGALTINGNATLAGGLTMELNRTNASATNDSLVVTGTLTAGGTLTVKNLGQALHVGDKFQLFANAVTGFSAINLPIIDSINGYAYTWANNIGADGSIQVLTAAPAVANYLFRSVASGNWSDASTWQQSTNGVNWLAAIGTPDYTASNILIQTGNTVTNLLAVTVDHVTVQTNATVLLTTGSMTITNSTAAVDFLVGGTLSVGVSSGVINISSLAALVFTNGGAYVWNCAAVPTIPTATWQNGSVCRISAMATGLVGGISGQSFYDFIWDTTAAGQSSRGRLNITGTNTVIRRDFTVTIPDTSGASMTINNDANGILTVGRNVSLTGGNIAGSGVKLLLNNAGGETNIFKVGGNFTVAGYIDGFGSSLTTFEFNGTGTQSLTLPASAFLITSSAMNWLVDASSTVTLASSVQAFNNFTNNGTLTFGVNTISGGAALVLNSGGKVNGNGTNLLVSGIGSIITGGTLNLTNSVILPTFAGGESFPLFSASSYSGTFGTLLPTTPDVTHTWVTTQLNTAGTLAVSGGINTNAPQVQVSVTGNTLSLAWPTNKGWTLLTNSAGLSATSQWFPYPNSANLTNVNIPMDPTKTNVFFRMAYPYP